MSKHCWRPAEDCTKMFECIKCGTRRAGSLVVFLELNTPLGVRKKECPGSRQAFRRALRRYIREQGENHGKTKDGLQTTGYCTGVNANLGEQTDGPNDV